MNTYQRATITAEAAQSMVAAAYAKARELGVAVAIVVVDDAGVAKASLRMDGVNGTAGDLALNKAYSAAAFSMPTGQWHDVIKEDPSLLHGIPHIPRLVIFGGGYPVFGETGVIAAIGVSGAYAHQDAEIAEAGLAAVA